MSVCPRLRNDDTQLEEAGVSDETKRVVSEVMWSMHSAWNWLYSRPHNPSLQRAAAGLSSGYQGLIDWCHENGVDLDDDNLPPRPDLK